MTSKYQTYRRTADSTLSRRLARHLDDVLARPMLRNVHAVVITHRGTPMLECYFEGEDERWGQSLGTVVFDPDTLHDVRSVTKSIVGLLYGIALDEGRVPPLSAPLIDHLPEFEESLADPVKPQITVEDALTMRLGLRWDESVPYCNTENSEVAMELSGDRVAYVMSREFVETPGTRWNYSGGATALIGVLIESGTGMRLTDFASSRLFAPLGIERFEWVTGADGVALAASGLRLLPRDMARIGQLVVDRGRHGNKQIVSPGWVDDMLTPRARVDDDIDYGYQWWIARRWRWVAAFGNGGQRLTVLPDANVVIAVNAGNYNAQDAWQVPVTVLTDVVLPALAD